MRVLAVLFLCACSGGDQSQLSKAPASLTALTYNMYYGLAADLLPEDLRIGSLSASAVAILNATTLTDFRCRIQAAARQIVMEQPDVIGLQEALLVAYARDFDDPDDDTVLIDFINELEEAIVAAGGPRYQAFARNNAVIQDTLPLVGGIRIADRGAILVNPKFPAAQISSFTYHTLQPGSSSVPGTNGVVVRGAIHVRSQFQSGTLDFYTTHLQSGGDPAVRLAQAQELADNVQANTDASSTVVVLGDMNDIPGSAAYDVLTANLTDTYGLVGIMPGFTAYQTQTLSDPIDQATLRIDYVLTRGSSAVDDSRVILNQMVPPCGLWISDHFGVVSRFKTNASQ